MNPQHFTAPDPCLCFPFKTDAKVIVFLSLLFSRENLISLAASVTSAPLVLPSHSIPSPPPLRNALQSLFLILSPSLPPSFLWTMGALGRLGAERVWLIYSSPPVKRDTVTTSLSSGFHPRSCLVSVRDQEPSRGGAGNSMAG